MAVKVKLRQKAISGKRKSLYLKHVVARIGYTILPKQIQKTIEALIYWFRFATNHIDKVNDYTR